MILANRIFFLGKGFLALWTVLDIARPRCRLYYYYYHYYIVVRADSRVQRTCELRVIWFVWFRRVRRRFKNATGELVNDRKIGATSEIWKKKIKNVLLLLSHNVYLPCESNDDYVTLLFFRAEDLIWNPLLTNGKPQLLLCYVRRW